MPKETITIALDRYDRHVPLFLGTVKSSNGINWRALEVGMVPPRRDGVDRHRRMLQKLEFDACEVSLAHYIMSKDQGTPLTAVPVFPRRLFSQNHIFVNRAAGIRKPTDLIGKRVGLWGFQVTMSVLAKGDLKFYYDTPWEKITWVTQYPEDFKSPSSDLPIELVKPGSDLAKMFVDGELAGYVNPHPPAIVQASRDRVRRLFENPELECLSYFQKAGHYPIMHLIAIKEDSVATHPTLPTDLIAMWEESKRQAEDFYHDPGYALLVFARNEYEKQRELLGADLWVSGFKANRANLEQFIMYMFDQRLIRAPMTPESLFHPSVLST